MHNKPPFSQTWDLDSLFPGGSSSPQLVVALDQVKQRVKHLEQKFKHVADLPKGIIQFQELEGQCQELESFISCLLAQDVNDQQALQLHSQVTQLRANCDSLGVKIDTLLAQLDDATFSRLLEDSEMHPIAFHLQERRQIIKNKLPAEQEKLVHQLGVDGYQGWNDLYGAFMGKLRINSPIEPEASLSVGQAENQLIHSDRHIRQAWFQRWEETWTSHEDLAAQMLNHLAGFRLNLYAARRWSSILFEPLFCNRMQEKTLRTMWSVIEEHKECLQKYLACKAELLGIECLAWYDVEAPLPFAAQPRVSYDQAAELIISCFSSFSTAMGDFAKEAFEKRWIEAEDRPDKRPGGFCTPSGLKQQSRVFMTYSGTMSNLFTLAHELGHAYHNHEVRKLPIFAQQYRMNVAETASTLGEMAVIDSMIQQTQDSQAKLSLIDYKLQRAVLFCMNIHARFLFENDFYQARRKGFVPAKELNILMEEAQKRAFTHTLSQWHPHFWVPKQHFYITDVPFYNFPYTFGYLFSQGIYALLKPQKNAAEAYTALLRDTGCLTVEDLASRHLGVLLEEPYFWQNALQLIEYDVDTYIKYSH